MVGWFLRGLIGYFYMTDKVKKFTEQATHDALKLLGTTAQDIAFIKQVKYMVLQESEMYDELKVIKNVDDYEFYMWKRNAIANYKSNFPHNINSGLSVETWEDAMSEIEEIYYQELHENNGNQSR
tara:strand:+ start:268 stop:642 length:375 start_codon:yes stop_codon:yes gene_type:complete